MISVVEWFRNAEKAQGRDLYQGERNVSHSAVPSGFMTKGDQVAIEQ